MEDVINKTYKICDVNQSKNKAVVATSLEDLLTKVPDKLGLPPENLTVVLESDGTEVDDEEYFSTLHPDTSLMILHGTEKWGPNIPKCKVSLDQTDDKASQVVNLVFRLQHNLCHIALLGDEDLELLSEMNPDSLADIVTDRNNRISLEHIKETSGRILLETREAQDAMELLKLYHQIANGSEDVSSPAYEASKSASPRAQTTMEVVHQDVQRALEHTKIPAVVATSRAPLRHQQHQHVANGSEDVSSPAYEASKSASPCAQTTMEVIHQEVARALEHTEIPVNATSRSPLRHQQHQRPKLRLSRRTHSSSNPLFHRIDSAQKDSYVSRIYSKSSSAESAPKFRHQIITLFWKK